MSLLIWLLFGFAGFAMCKVVDAEGFGYILWFILEILFLTLALTLAII